MEVPEESFHWSSWDSRTCYPRRAFIQELTDDLSYCFTVIATAPSLLFSPSSSCSILWEQEREEGVREEVVWARAQSSVALSLPASLVWFPSKRRR